MAELSERSFEEHLLPSAYSVDNPPPYFIRLFEHAALNQDFYRLMPRGEGISRFQKPVKEYIAEAVSDWMGKLPPAAS